MMAPRKKKTTIDLKEYGLALHQKMSEAWELARGSIGQAQKKQKGTYDRRAKMSVFREGERVFLFRPAEKTGAARKLARPFHGPYRLVELGPNTAKIRRVDRPEEEPILVAIDRLRRCPAELADDFWPPDRAKRKSRAAPTTLPEQPRTGGESSSVSVSTPLTAAQSTQSEKGQEAPSRATETDRNSSLTSAEVQSDLPVGCASPPVADCEVGSNWVQTLPQSDGVVSDGGGAEESSVVGNGRGGGRELDVETKSAADTSCAEEFVGRRKDPGPADILQTPKSLTDDKETRPDTQHKWRGRLRSRDKHRRNLSPRTDDTQQGEL